MSRATLPWLALLLALAAPAPAAPQQAASWEPLCRRTDRPPPRPHPDTGYAATEAPRGLLYHRYRIDADGTILDAKIVPPTSQNQKTIENDLWRFIPPRLDLTQEQLRWQCEQAVRNYDPCISCATHFLKLKIERENGFSN